MMTGILNPLGQFLISLFFNCTCIRIAFNLIYSLERVNFRVVTFFKKYFHQNMHAVVGSHILEFVGLRGLSVLQ